MNVPWHVPASRVLQQHSISPPGKQERLEQQPVFTVRGAHVHHGELISGWQQQEAVQVRVTLNGNGHVHLFDLGRREVALPHEAEKFDSESPEVTKGSEDGKRFKN